MCRPIAFAPIPLLLAPLLLAGCVPSHPVPQPRPAPPPPPARALPAAPPQQDWRDVPLTPGRWTWRGEPDSVSVAQFGEPGRPALFALRCDFATRALVFSRAGAAGTGMTFTSSFGPFALTAQPGGGIPPAIVAQTPARDSRLDQLAFSRGRFLVDVTGQPQLVLPAWPEIARVIEDCRF